MLKSSRFRSPRAASTSNKTLRLESLEDKAMLAGDVAASLLDNDLFLVGDAESNQFEIVRDVTQAESGVGEITIRGLDGTTINGLTEVTFSGENAVTGDIEVDLTAGGIDQVRFGEAGSTESLALPADLRIEAGSPGSQTVILENVQLGDDLRIDSNGSLESDIDVISSTIDGGVSVYTTTDETTLLLDRSTVGASVYLSASGGTFSEVDTLDSTIGYDVVHVTDTENSNTRVDGSNIGNSVIADTSGEDNTFVFGSGTLQDRNSIVNNLKISGGNFSDEIEIESTDIGNDLVLDLLDGENRVLVLGSNIGDDFRAVDGDNGDVPGEYVVAESTIGDDVFLSGNAGVDLIEFEFVTVGDDFVVKTGSGDDELFLVDSQVADQTLISLGTGFDQTEVEDTNAGKRLSIFGRDENDIQLSDVVTSYSVLVWTQGGDDIVDFENVDTHFAAIFTFSGQDEVLIRSGGEDPSEIDYLLVSLGDGDDSLLLDGLVADLALISGGGGNDTLTEVGDVNDIAYLIDFAFEDFPEV